MIREVIDILELNEAFSTNYLISKRMIPLSLVMMNNLGYSYPDSRVYHVGNLKDLKRLAKIQGSKRQISTFTKGGPELERLPGQPNLLVELIGTEVVRGKSDIWTFLDNRGRRWVNQADNSDGKMTFMIDGIISKIFRGMGIDLDIEAMNPSQLERELKGLSSNDQKKFFGFYLKEMERYLDKGGYKEFSKFLENPSDFKYNEIILTKFTILGVRSLANHEAIESACLKLNLKYKGSFERKGLSDLEI